MGGVWSTIPPLAMNNIEFLDMEEMTGCELWEGQNKNLVFEGDTSLSELVARRGSGFHFILQIWSMKTTTEITLGCGLS